MWATEGVEHIDETGTEKYGPLMESSTETWKDGPLEWKKKESAGRDEHSENPSTWKNMCSHTVYGFYNLARVQATELKIDIIQASENFHLAEIYK